MGAFFVLLNVTLRVRYFIHLLSWTICAVTQQDSILRAITDVGSAHYNNESEIFIVPIIFMIVFKIQRQIVDGML